jgi:hypothetical protein
MSGSFRFRDRAIDLSTGEASFSYVLDGDEFVERLVLPVGDGAVPERLLDVAHVVIGTSYYKLSAPPRLVFDRPIAPEVAALAAETYDEGLREFAFTNGLPVPHVVSVEADVVDDPAVTATLTSDWPLLPIGGGKDSAAVLSMLRDGATAVTISATGAQRRLAAAAGIELLEVGRTLDPKLAERTAAGGLNGHIPITAVNSAISCLGAALWGHDAVVLGNERSASEPTRIVAKEGVLVPVNHQHSKSFAYEEAFARAVEPAGIAYFSVLRQLSELAIAGIVVDDGRLLGDFLSCNRAFVRSRAADAPQTWCLECAKCTFTFLMFAPFLTVDAAAAVFGGNPLELPSMVDAFAALWDPDAKPFDCVGERMESAVAMARLAASDGWSSLPVVRALGAAAAAVADGFGATFASVLEPGGPHRIPAPLAALVADRVPR